MGTVGNWIKPWIARTSSHPWVYRHVWHPIIRLSALAFRGHRWALLRSEVDPDKVVRELSPEFVVLNGPFRGLKYGDTAATGSSFRPKIIGSYEAELHGSIEKLTTREYAQIVDIGCAEGYYAIGFALQNQHVQVLAYDTLPGARRSCQSLAELNQVADRVTIAGLCTAAELRAGAGEKRRLIIADCEGFEQQLFDAETCRALANDDLIIEVHDFLIPTLSATLLPRLTATHNVTRVPSVTDFARPLVFPYPQIQHYPYATQAELMAEFRPLEMEWFVCQSRNA